MYFILFLEPEIKLNLILAGVLTKQPRVQESSEFGE